MSRKSTSPIANFIIGGTEKAGTTSIYTYLAAHPEVCASRVKETDFFRKQYTANREADISEYSAYFSACKKEQSVIFEASPGYLGESAIVSERIAELVPDAKILFILRDPIDRIHSSFHFHVGKLNISKDISFSDYIEKCMQYTSQNITAEESGIDEWYLKALEYGNYGERLTDFYRIFPEENIKIVFFDDLRNNPLDLMLEICDFLGIYRGFYAGYEFNKVNVTFSSKYKLIHAYAIKFNSKTEQFFRRHPSLKKHLVKTYKWFNQSREGYEQMPSDIRLTLKSYYADSNNIVKSLLSGKKYPSWL